MSEKTRIETTFHDALVDPEQTGLAAGFFDRLMFNAHPVSGDGPSLIMGYGMYPPKGTVDGFVVLTHDGEQRNLRFASLLANTEGATVGPLSCDLIEDNSLWRLQLAANDIGVEFDLQWQARTPAWFGEVAVENSSETRTAFDHLFQSGRYSGTLSIDGKDRDVDGWYGQRDRSRGVRTMSGGQGLHLWYQAQFPECSVGFLLVETRQQERLLLKGAVMGEDGSLDTIIDVRHALDFSETLDLRSGTVQVRTESGRTMLIRNDGGIGGGYMAGAGYGGHHGRSHGVDHVESDRYTLDGSVNPRTVDSALTDRLCTFDLDGVAGSGIFEFAVTRSKSYSYRATL